MQKKRKVVLIMTDTQRKDMLGCYGNSDMKTPCLDKLASEGIRFDKAYTCQPVCGPARSAIFTGLWPHSNGSWTNSYALGDNVKTVGQRLTDNGIQSTYIGKYHLDGGDYFGLGRCPDGWNPEYWYDMKNYLDELSDEDKVRSRSPKLNRDENLTEDFTFGHRVSNRAVDFLSKNGDDDFFLVVSYDEPHDPYICPKPYSEMYKDYDFPKSKNIYDNLKDKPEHQRVWAGESLNENKDNINMKRADFLGCNSFIDYEIGRVIKAINEHSPDALIIYTSDHGDMLKSHSLNGKGPVMYDEITNIPFIVRMPESSTVDTSCNLPLSQIDITPTILDFMGLPVPKLLEGKSILNRLKNPTTSKTEPIFMEFGRYEVDHDGFGGFQPVRAVFDGRYKLVINLLTSDELYDHETDPEEMVNLIVSEKYIDIRDRLHDSLLNWMNDSRDPFRGYYWERRPWRKDASVATWDYTLMTRQRENEEYEPRQLNYGTGLIMEKAVRKKG